MKYQGKEFDAIVATPGCGKSYVCDKHPSLFVDVDEVRLRCEYFVPKNIIRAELEKTKGNRTFKRRAEKGQYIKELYKKLDKFARQGKTLIFAMQPETIDYLLKRNIKFAFVYVGKNMKDELESRMRNRGNSEELIDRQIGKFDVYYEINVKENRSVINYELKSGEYLEDAMKKFGCVF